MRRILKSQTTYLSSEKETSQTPQHDQDECICTREKKRLLLNCLDSSNRTERVKNMVKVRHWTLPKGFQGQVTENDLQLYEEEISEDLQPGGQLAVSFISFPSPLVNICRGSLRSGLFNRGSVHAVTIIRYSHTSSFESISFLSVHGEPIGEHKTMYGQGCLK